MQIRESAEDYLETILKLRGKLGQVRSIDIAHCMGFSKPSVSNAMKQFRENGYIEVDSDGFITLTGKGEAVALRVFERHTVLRDFLVGLGVDGETAAEDACKMEHDISDQSFEAIKSFMAEKK